MHQYFEIDTLTLSLLTQRLKHKYELFLLFIMVFAGGEIGEHDIYLLAVFFPFGFSPASFAACSNIFVLGGVDAGD